MCADQPHSISCDVFPGPNAPHFLSWFMCMYFFNIGQTQTERSCLHRESTSTLRGKAPFACGLHPGLIFQEPCDCTKASLWRGWILSISRTYSCLLSPACRVELYGEPLFLSYNTQKLNRTGPGCVVLDQIVVSYVLYGVLAAKACKQAGMSVLAHSRPAVCKHKYSFPGLWYHDKTTSGFMDIDSAIQNRYPTECLEFIKV